MCWQSAKPENEICKGSPLSQKFGTAVMTACRLHSQVYITPMPGIPPQSNMSHYVT